MTRDEAKKILVHYRPGVTDDNDPQFAAALDLVRRDPELAAWFQQQCAVFDAIRGKLKSIPVPQGLRRQIIVEHVENTRILPLTSRLLLVSAIAALALLTAIIWFQFKPGPQKGFENYRDIVARKVQRGYFMDMHEKDQAKIREFFHAKGAPADFVLPASLGKLSGEGGVAFNWNRHPVSLLCLNAAGKPGEKNDLYLFVTDRSGVPGAPAPGDKPTFKQVNLFMTMTWTVGDHVYLLTASGGEDEAALEKYLE
jgi:hypothetical protein